MKKAPLLQRLRAKKAAARTGLRTGVSWYTEEEWAKVKATAVDPERFEESYGEWLIMATDALRDIRNTGLSAEPVLIDAEEFLLWCRDKNRINNAATRAEFVSEKLKTQDGRP